MCVYGGHTMELPSGGGGGERPETRVRQIHKQQKIYIDNIREKTCRRTFGGEYKEHLKSLLPPWGMRWGSSPRLSNGCPPRHDSPRPGLPWLLKFVCRPLRTSLCSLRTCCCVDCTHRDDTDFNRQGSSKHTKGSKERCLLGQNTTCEFSG